ncbi:MAG: hypothetical protein AB8H86_06835 [Polyangiales bacterium]
MSEGASVEELRARVDTLTDSIAELSDGMESLRQDVFAAEKRVRDLDAELQKARRSSTGLFTTLLENFVAMGEAFPKVGALVAGVFAVGSLVLGLTQIKDCNTPPAPMRLEGRGTAMVATDEAILGTRCEFFARQVGAGQCLFELRCGESPAGSYAEVHRCVTDAYTEDTGEGGESTSYYLRGFGGSTGGGGVLSFSEYQRLLELKDGNEVLNVVFHELAGRSVLDTRRTWPPDSEALEEERPDE